MTKEWSVDISRVGLAASLSLSLSPASFDLKHLLPMMFPWCRRRVVTLAIQ